MVNNVSSWQQWSALDYLTTYFSQPGPDIIENLRFIVHELERFKVKNVPILDFGSGPTLITALAAEPYASELHLADYLHANLEEILKWKQSKADIFSWQKIVQEILKLENKEPIEITAKLRELSAKIKTTNVIQCDASKDQPLISGGLNSYNVVITNFCADSATSHKSEWCNFMKNISNLVKNKGLLIGGSLRNCSRYLVGDNYFPSPNINESDIKRLLVSIGFDPATITTKVILTPECEYQGFSSIVFFSAQKLMTAN